MTEAQILKAMKSLDLTREEAIEMLADDEAIEKGEKLFELSDEQKKVAKEMTSAGGGKHKERKPRERKVDTDKQTIIDVVRDGLERDLVDWGLMENITTKNESELSFTYNGNAYTLKLIKHRPPKGS